MGGAGVSIATKDKRCEMAAGGGRIAIHSPGTCWELQLTAREEERDMVVEGPASQALVVSVIARKRQFRT